MKFNKAMEALKRTQTAMKVELENTIVQLKNWKKKPHKENDSGRRQNIRTQG